MVFRTPLWLSTGLPENFVMISLTVHGVIMLTDRQTKAQTDTAENNTLATLRYTRVVITARVWLLFY